MGYTMLSQSVHTPEQLAELLGICSEQIDGDSRQKTDENVYSIRTDLASALK